MKYIIGALLGAHGVAHLVGFIAAWQLMPLAGIVFTTTILNGTLDVGTIGIRVVGVLWLAAALLFVVAAVALMAGSPSAFAITAIAVGWSTVMCVVGWPHARIGLYVNAGLLAVLALAWRAMTMQLAGFR